MAGRELGAELRVFVGRATVRKCPLWVGSGHWNRPGEGGLSERRQWGESGRRDLSGSTVIWRTRFEDQSSATTNLPSFC